MQLAFVANHRSGSGRVDLEEVGRLLEAGGSNDVRAIELGDLGSVDLSDADRLVVAGGDGTVGSAARCAMRTNTTLAVVPAGTANDFVRSVGLPLDPAAASRMAADPDAPERTAEIGMADETPFVNAAACGLTVAAARRASGLKRLLGPLAYGVGAVNAGFQAHTVTAKVLVGGEPLFHDACWQVMVAASGAFGGGASLGPVDPSDGCLDVAVIPKGSRTGLVGRAWGMRTGTLHEQDGIVYGRGAAIEVQGPRDFNLDGELRELDTARFTFGGTFEVVAPAPPA